MTAKITSVGIEYEGRQAVLFKTSWGVIATRGHSVSSSSIRKINENEMLCFLAASGCACGVQIASEWGATNFGEAIIKAAEKGHRSIMEQCFKCLEPTEVASIVDKAMIGAAKNGYDEVVKWCRSLGATDIAQTMAEAARNGHANIVQMCYDWGDKDSMHAACCEAAIGGHNNVIQLCYALGVRYFGRAGTLAARNGHISTVQLCCELGGDAFEEGYSWFD